MDNTVESTQLYEVRAKLAELEGRLIEAQPNMATLLREIHQKLGADPELVTLLTEEECSILVKGLVKQTGTEIAATALKKNTKSVKSIGLTDL